VRLTGSGQDPHAEGFVDIKNGAFGVPLGGVAYTGLDTRIDLSPDSVRIQKFQILDEEGETLTVAGELAVHAREVGALNITLQSDNFELIDNELGDVGVDSDLKITGQLRRPRIEGEVRVEAGRIEVDRVLQLTHDPYRVGELPAVVSAERSVEGAGSAEEATRNALARAERSAAPPKEAADPDTPVEPAGGFAPVALDIHVVIPDNLVLRGNDLRPGGPTGAAIGDMNLTVGGDFYVRKAAGGEVALMGVVNTVRGTYEFQGRRFDLVRGGTLRFTGDTGINPLLDVTARRVIPNTGVEARVHIRGTVEAPELELSSTPPLEESDILALIVFNRPVNELGTGERASLAATAGGIATGFIAAPLGDSIGRALDVDLFEITTTTDSGELGAGITIGQQIGDRAFFKVRQQFGNQSVSEFMLEYQLADFLRLQATAAPETSGSANRLGQRRVERAGIDLIFFFSY
jgi:translocation and assembly module TamB